MVVPELKELFSPDLEDMEGSEPADRSNFGILVQALIGPAGDEAADTFSFMVCTPAWLAAELTSEPHAWGRSLLIVPSYDFAAIHGAIVGLCSEVEGEEWDDVAGELARYTSWEFEGFEDEADE